MSHHNSTGSMGDHLSRTTSIFGLKLWVVLGVSVGAAFVLLLFFITVCLALKRSRNDKKRNVSPMIPVMSKEIQEIWVDPVKANRSQAPGELAVDHFVKEMRDEEALMGGYHRAGNGGIQIDIGKEHLISYPVGSSDEATRSGSGSGSGSGGGGTGSGSAGTCEVVPGVSHLGWGHWYTLRELEVATNCFSPENIIGEGGYGIVYFGVLEDESQIAVKNLLNNKGQAEREFKVEVEAIGRVRHKNLVRLIGYCAEGAHRMLVYEYINNGNLEQWLHGEVGPSSPLTWEIRMNIILGTAKGLTYLHEGLEPKVVHRDIKSSNILLDKQWNSKVSDFGLAKLICSERSYITTRVMGTFGYVAPEYASTGMLNDRSDVYSFGILIMEIISGRNPVDYALPQEQVHLVEWVKKLVRERNPEGVLDPKLKEKPTTRALKKTLLVALRCVDPNAQKRPKMGHIVHMLEVDDAPYGEDRRMDKCAATVKCDDAKVTSTVKSETVG